MKKTFRRILFWLLFVLFLITAPVAILYSQGYRFDQGKMIFVHSGAITVKSVPSSVNLSLDEKPQPAKALDVINGSITLGGLRPSSYRVRASLDGYSDWEKTAEVHSGLSTEFWNVVLVPKNPELVKIASHDTARFFPSPFGKKIAFVENLDRGISLLVTDFKKNEFEELFLADNVSFSENKLDNLEWNYKEDLMLSPIIKDGKSDYLVTSAEKLIEPVFLSEISKLSFVQKARWSPKEKDVIYFLATDKITGKEGLFRISLGNGSAQLVIPEAKTYDISQDAIYYIQNNNILFNSDLDGGNVSQIAGNPLSENDIGKSARLIVYDDDRQALITEKGELILRNNGAESFLRKISDGSQGIQFSDDGKKLLFWTDNEISVMFLRPWEVQPYREENEMQTIIRLSTPLENVFWFKDYEHVFFSTQNKIKLIELDPRDHRICLDVFENNLDDFPATYDSGNGYYFFVRDTGGDKKIFYFILPEKTGIFG
jgi:hypothetical protein